MYIMLVDDEPIILNGVERMIQRRWPEYEIQKFESAQPALEAIRTRIPDLLISDIYMPETDGMSFVEQAQALGCTRYAFLTGYDEFELAQRALRLQSKDYLLKPVNKAELYRLVEMTAKQLEDKAQMSLTDLIACLRLIALYGVSTDEFSEIDFARDPRLKAGKALLLLKKPASPLSDGDILACLPGCFPLQNDLVGNELTLYLGDCRDDALAALAEKLSYAECVVGYAMAPWKPDELSTLYRHALEQSSAEIRQLQEARREQGEESDRFLSLLTEKLAERRASLRAQMMFARQLAYGLEKQTTSWELIKLCSAFLPGLPEQDRRGRILAWLHRLEPLRNVLSKEILEALDYVDAHYAEDVTLAVIASKVYLPESYLSTLFHKEAGCTYIRYVSQMRIENACRLIMEEPESSLDAIAFKVGIQNPHYFYKVFKNYTDLTPGAFRELYVSLLEAGA